MPNDFLSYFADPGPSEETRGFAPDPMAGRAKAYLRSLGVPDNPMFMMPPPPEDERTKKYGGIRASRFGDDPMDYLTAVMIGPISVEKALANIPLKALPADVVKARLLKAGASKAELETRGIAQFLESKGNAHVDPSELVDYIQRNPFELKETTKLSKERLTQKQWDEYHKMADEYNSITRAEYNANTPEYSEAASRKLAEIKERMKPFQKAAENPTKFEQWQTPGGKNYREILLQTPSNKIGGYEVVYSKSGTKIYSPNRDTSNTIGKGNFATFEEAQHFVNTMFSDPSLLKIRPVPPVLFNGQHFFEPNVLAHIRVNDRKLPSGEKALHVEEWQSDWAQEIRRPYKYAVTDDKAPYHPLAENWQDLVARRSLKEAVDGGYDRLTWVTGQQTADRYDLSKQIDRLLYIPEEKSLQIIPKGATPRDLPPGADPEYWEKLASNVSPKDIEKYVGKEISRRLLATNSDPMGTKYLEGLDLKVGGEWANKLYDESMVNRFNKIGKRYGVKVEDMSLGPTKGWKLEPGRGMESNTHIFNSFRESYIAFRSDWIDAGGKVWGDDFQMLDGTWVPFKEALKQTGSKLTDLSRSDTGVIHSLKITPDMRKKIGSWKFHAFEDVP